MKLVFVKLKLLISVTAILLWIGLIFYFANASGWESWQTSGRALEAVQSIGAPIESEELVRKMAHVFLYAVLGGLSLNLLHQLDVIRKRWAEWVNKRKFKLALIIPLVVAVVDEISQYFTPGRSGVWYDVVLDVLAAAIVVGVVYRIYKVREKQEG